MCAFDAVCPTGKGAAEWRAGYGRVAEKSGSSKRFAHQGALPARRGRRSPFAPFSMKGTAALSSAYERRMVHRPASSAAAFSPCRPAGRTAGSARTRPRVQTLENPFLGNRLHLSPSSRPPKRRRRQAPARGSAAVYPHHRSMRNETKHPCPLLVGHGCVFHAPKALAAGTAGALPAKGRKSSKCRFLRCIGMCTGSRLPRTCKSVQA